jgi:hypothetical protein
MVATGNSQYEQEHTGSPNGNLYWDKKLGTSSCNIVYRLCLAKYGAAAVPKASR